MKPIFNGHPMAMDLDLARSIASQLQAQHQTGDNSSSCNLRARVGRSITKSIDREQPADLDSNSKDRNVCQMDDELLI
jgi:hypothetical protein